MRTLSAFFCTTLAAGSLTAGPLFANAGPDISGDWLRSDGTTRVHIAACGSQICAINTWVKDPSRGEQVGDRLVMTLTPQGASKLIGAAFDVRRKLNYSMNITVERDSMLTQGCVLQGIVCKTMSWTRAG